ncbi:TIP41-like protein [Drosophila kikkawai]|uniref:TIP41-like protein n=1 Tax=Drosophila kikkawai TaxID=30033 RepID=A0A6P4J2M0_DROKI|nr:TIP41-like protein [Drosophila kikkawai]
MARACQCLKPHLPEINFHDWIISCEKSHILHSVCKLGNDQNCSRQDPNRCDLCLYRLTLELPRLPDMVFFKNKLVLQHKDGALIEFKPMDSLAVVSNGKQPLEMASAHLEQSVEEKFKPFDWTFTSTYQGSMNKKVRVESTDQALEKFKLMQREPIVFHHDITLFEDELNDRGISKMSVRIRVMPSGFFILLRHFLRVDRELICLHDTRFHHQVGNDFILKEYSHREAHCSELQSSVAFWTKPDEMQEYLPLKSKELYKLYF